MKINQVKIKKLANLSRLNLNKSEIQNLFTDLKKILDFIDKLDEVNTENVQPLTHIHKAGNIYRDDNVSCEDIKASVLKQAPNHNSDYFKVPKILKT